MLSLSLRVCHVCAPSLLTGSCGEEGGFLFPGFLFFPVKVEEGDLSEGGRLTLTQGSQLWVDSVWSTGYRERPEGTVSFRRGEANSWAALQTLPCLGKGTSPPYHTSQLLCILFVKRLLASTS